MTKDLSAIFRGKRPSFLPGQKTAWLMHGPANAGQNIVADDIERSLPVHARASTIRITDHMPVASTIDRAIAGGYSMILDVDFADTTQRKPNVGWLAARLKGEGYHLTLASCWAPMDVCMARNPAAEPHLITSRVQAFETFQQVSDTANMTRVFYLTEPTRVPGEVLSAARVDMRDISFKTTSEHRNLLARMIEDTGRDGMMPGPWANDLMDDLGVTRAQLHVHGQTLASTMRRMAGVLLTPTGGKPSTPSGL